jgi:histone acetyltransferase HTATIP
VSKKLNLKIPVLKFSFIFLAVNKRLDEWVTEDRLDTRKVQFPRKDGVSSQSGLQTPNRRVEEPQEPSRPETPPSTPGELVNGNAVLAAALNKKLTRKRKMPSIEAEVNI